MWLGYFNVDATCYHHKQSAAVDLLRCQKHNQSEVDRLGRQQPVTLGRVRQGHQFERALCFRLGKVMLVDLGLALDVREWSSQHKKVHRQWARGLGLEDQLVVDVPLARLMGIALTLVDDGLHDPLVVEGGKARRFVVQTVHVLVGTVWLHLEIIEDNLLVTQEIDQREEKLLLLGRAGIVSV